MAGFETKDAVDLLYKQTTVINGLWTTYAAAGLTTGGFTALNGSDSPGRIVVAVMLTAGFGAFAYGNWRMLRSEIGARWILAEELRREVAALQATADSKFAKALAQIPGNAASVTAGRMVH